MMIFTVNVVGNCAANRDKFSTGRYRQEPATWHKLFQNIGQRDTSLATQQSLLLIERDKASQVGDIERDAAFVQAAIAIAAPIAIGKHRCGKVRQVGQLIAPEEWNDLLWLNGGITTPGLR